VLDTKKDEVVSEIKIGADTHGIVLSKDGKRAYVSVRKEHFVAVVDVPGRKVLAKIPVSELPDIPDLSPDGKELWVTSRRAHAVDVIDLATNTKIHTIKVGLTAEPDPHGLVISAR
jgi:YVTN family beta-propeller protein